MKYLDLFEIWFTHKELYKLYEKYEEDIPEIEEIMDLVRIDIKRREIIINKYKEYDPKNTEKILYESWAYVIYNYDERFPYWLKEIAWKPFLIYVRWELIKARKNIWVIWSRNCSAYWRSSTNNIVKDLVLNDAIIVSGWAIWIDSSAHISAISNWWKTYSIIWTWIDVCYPTSNRKMYENISQNWAIISTFRLKTKPDKFNFPIRNEIIAWICDAVIVIEAWEKSWSIITAKLALEYNKDVFVVPWDINKQSSKWTNWLIRDSVWKLILWSEDILSEIWISQRYRSRQLSFEDMQEKEIYENVSKWLDDTDKISDKMKIWVEIISYKLTMMEMKEMIRKDILWRYTII